MYYIVNEEKGLIMDISSSCPDPQKEANFFQCAVYIIEGQHAGLSATPESPDEEKND